MRHLLCPAYPLALLLFAAGAVPGAPGPDPEDARIAALVRQLNDGSYARREAAAKGLRDLGAQALPALRAAEADGPPEVRLHAGALIRDIILTTRTSGSTGLSTALVEPGEFPMGETNARPGRDDPAHKVRITRPFLIGTREVTQGQYAKVMGVNPSWFSAGGGGKEKLRGVTTDQLPVEGVTWFDAVEFCNKLSRLDGYEPYYELADVERRGDSITAAAVKVLGGNGYRLPTEAEWEYACRAGTATPFHFGSRNTGREANVKSGDAGAYGINPQWHGPDRPAPVASYAPNNWGLFDMHGNVAEWCWDWYGKDYYAGSPAEDPQGPAAGDHRVLRGGSWLVTEGSARSAARFWHAPGDGPYYAGFRVARTP